MKHFIFKIWKIGLGIRQPIEQPVFPGKSLEQNFLVVMDLEKDKSFRVAICPKCQTFVYEEIISAGKPVKAKLLKLSEIFL